MTSPTLDSPAQVGSDAPNGDGIGRIAALDGLRGLAIAGVIAFHFGLLRGGYLGVDLFFVVSGFLITRQLLDHRSNGPHGGTLRWFWSRRARRLLPALVVCIAATMAWTVQVGSITLVERTRGQAMAGLAFASNWWELHAGTGYWAIPADRTPLGHLWSLAVEEQFYLLWPLVLLLVVRLGARRRALLAVVAIGSLASFGVQWTLASAVQRPYLGTDARIGAILLGAGVAVWSDGRPLPPRRRGRFAGSAVGALALAGLAVAWSTQRLEPDLFHGRLAACSMAAAVAVAAVCLVPDGPLAQVLARPSIVALGSLSYLLYLWHVPAVVLITQERTGFSADGVLGLRIAVTAFAVAITRRFIERPIHVHGWARPVVGRAAAAGAVLVLAGAFVVPRLHAAAPDPVPPALKAAPIERSFTRAEVEDLSIMVVGDSWGMRTQYGMGHMAQPLPKMVISGAMPSCGIANPIQEVAGNGARFAPTASCLAWRTTWKRNLDAGRPGVVILQVGNWDQAPQQFEPGGPFLGPCDDAYQERYRSHLDDALAILSGTDRHVFLATVRDNEGDARAKSDCMNDLLIEGVQRDQTGRVHLLDLRHHLCPGDQCLTHVDGRPLYDETAHIALDQLPGVNAWIFGQIGNVLGTQRPPVDHWS